MVSFFLLWYWLTMKGIDQIRHGLGLQVRKRNMEKPFQFCFKSQQQQHKLAHALAYINDSYVMFFQSTNDIYQRIFYPENDMFMLLFSLYGFYCNRNQRDHILHADLLVVVLIIFLLFFCCTFICIILNVFCI